MKKLKYQIIQDQETWERYVLKHPEANFLHSYSWGQFWQQLGSQVYFLGVFKSSKQVGAVLLVKEEAKRGDYLACAGGPLLDDFKSDFPQLVLKIKSLAYESQVRFVRVRPQIKENQENRELFSQNGFVPAPMHMQAETTWQLDLAQTEEQILKDMRKTTRHSVKAALKQATKIKITKDISAVDRLFELQMKTAKRHNFVPFGKKFLKTQFKVFSQKDQCVIFEAYVKEKLAVSAMVMFYGNEAVYHYSGSNQLARETGASYLVQWRIIKEAKRRGFKRYNFWGVVPDHNPKHRFWGVTVFKRGFGGFPVNYLHAHDLPVKISYWLTHIFERLRKWHRQV